MLAHLRNLHAMPCGKLLCHEVDIHSMNESLTSYLSPQVKHLKINKTSSSKFTAKRNRLDVITRSADKYEGKSEYGKLRSQVRSFC